MIQIELYFCQPLSLDNFVIQFIVINIDIYHKEECQSSPQYIFHNQSGVGVNCKAKN